MKTPICGFDAKTGILCPICEARLKSGHITQADVDLSVKLTKIAERVPELNRITLLKGHEVDGDLVMVLGVGETAPLKREATIMKKIEAEIGRPIWLVEGETRDREFLEDLFYPVRILTVNTVWLPDGSKLTRVIIPGRRSQGLHQEIERIKKVAKWVRGIELLVEFERG